MVCGMGMGRVLRWVVERNQPPRGTEQQPTICCSGRGRGNRYCGEPKPASNWTKVPASVMTQRQSRRTRLIRNKADPLIEGGKWQRPVKRRDLDRRVLAFKKNSALDTNRAAGKIRSSHSPAAPSLATPRSRACPVSWFQSHWHHGAHATDLRARP